MRCIASLNSKSSLVLIFKTVGKTKYFLQLLCLFHPSGNALFSSETHKNKLKTNG